MPTPPTPPGEMIKRYLKDFGWSQIELADIMERSTALINEIISGTRSITSETASRLGVAFGTGAQFWMDLETSYQLATMKDDTRSVARKARLYAMAPVRDMLKRGWIAEAKSMEALEHRILSFFELDSMEQRPSFGAHAAKRANYKELSAAQQAWLYRVRQLAYAVWAERFSPAEFERGVSDVRQFLRNTPDIRKLPKYLADIGIRFLIVEALPHSKIDGVCFWLDNASPVIAVSLRYDRIDAFWQTVAHELEHVRNGDGKTEIEIDIDLINEDALTQDKPDAEKRVDQAAADFLIPSAELEFFIARVKPLYSKDRIKGFANRINVHPGLVVGQLQHRHEIGFAHNREMLVKVRHIVVESALTDGWGNVPQVGSVKESTTNDIQ